MVKIVERATPHYACEECGEEYRWLVSAENCEKECRCKHTKGRYRLEARSCYGCICVYIVRECTICKKELGEKHVDEDEFLSSYLKKIYHKQINK